MDLIADILLISGAAGVAFYCFVLSRRLTRFTDLEHGVGGAVAVLSAQVDDLTKALERARAETAASGEELRRLTDRSEGVARKLELHLASLHDLPDPAPRPDPVPDPASAADPLPDRASASVPGSDPGSGAAPATPAPSAATPGTPSFFASHRSPREVA